MQPERNLDLSKTYIFEGDEYILTGRVASKSDEAITRTRRSRRRRTIGEEEQQEQQDLMVEIKPVSRGNPVLGINSEEKWVKYIDLYAVIKMISEEDDEAYKDD